MTASSIRITLMDRARIERTIRRVAYQVTEKIRDEKRICLIGLNQRGYAVAEELHKRLESATGGEVVLLQYSVTENSDTEKKRPDRQIYDREDTVVLVIDDVMFSGRTLFTAIRDLFDTAERVVYAMVLVDRGHRSLPIAPEFVGMEIPTKPKEHVEVVLREGLAEEVFLYRK